MQRAEETGKVKTGAKARHVRRSVLAVLSVLMLLLSAGCGQKSGAEASSESAAATEETVVTEGTEGSAGSEQTAALTGEETGTASEEESSGAEETGETEEAPPALVVTKHKEDGTHMVTAGAMTISVPTTFEGLEMEGAEFQGDHDLVLSGKTGTARMKYKGGFGSIRITVKNNTEYDMEVRECTIIGVEVGSTEPDPELTLYGIPMGATRQEIADVYGEPFSKTFDDENHLSNMVYQFGTDIHSNQVVMIIFRDKKAVAASYEDFSLVRR